MNSPDDELKFVIIAAREMTDDIRDKFVDVPQVPLDAENLETELRVENLKQVILSLASMIDRLSGWLSERLQ